MTRALSPQLQQFLGASVSEPAPGTAFATHGIWTLGVKLMRNLNFVAKALIISLLFLAPLALLGYFFGANQNEQIAFSNKERVGIVALRHVLPVYSGLLDARNATRATLGGFDGASRYQAARAKTDLALSAFDNYLSTSGDVLVLKPEFEKLKAAWKATESSGNGVDSAGRTVFGPVTASTVHLLNLIGDNSNLVLDPDLDSFYLMSTMVLSLPQLAEDVGQLRAWGTYALARPGLTVAEAKRYAVWVSGVETGIRQAHSYLQHALTANPQLKSTLNLAVLDDVAAFQAFSSDPEALIERKDLTPLVFYDKGEVALQGLLSFYEKGLPALDEMLSARVTAMEQRLVWITASVGFALVLAFYFFYSFFLVTRGGLQLISLHLREMAEGDLRRPPSQPWGKDEPALVIVDLRTAYNALHMLIRKVRHSARALHGASDEMAAASTDLSARTESAAASLEEQAAAMEQIGSTVSATAEQAHMAATFAQDNAHVAAKGGKVFAEVVSTMREIHTSSSRISDIVSVIDGIAFQTNILALNAAVEAARAGESGRGFAVVASEVRSLAKRSADAAREIKGLISTSMDKVQSGTAVVETAGTAMNEVVTNATQINFFLGEISTAAREQALGVKEVGQAIQVLDQSTQQNAALVEQITAAADGLRHQAGLLQEEISNFRVA